MLKWGMPRVKNNLILFFHQPRMLFPFVSLRQGLKYHMLIGLGTKSGEIKM